MMNPLQEPPQTAAARAATEIAREYLTPALLNHSLRTWLFAQAFGDSDAGLDVELLYVGAVLHDIALVEPFDSYRTDFEFASGAVAGVLTAGAGWDAGRRHHLAAAIVAHMSASPVVEGGREGYLLDVATGLDISGTHPDALPRAYLEAVVRRFPRLDIAEGFAQCAADQAARKPDSAAARISKAGVATRLQENFLERLG